MNDTETPLDALFPNMPSYVKETIAAVERAGETSVVERMQFASSCTNRSNQTELNVFNQRTYNRLLKSMRNNPKSVLRDGSIHLAAPRNAGKTSTASLFINTLAAMMYEHPRRMRGKYVHMRKGRVIRRHAMRTSFADSPLFRGELKRSGRVEISISG